MTMLHRKEQVVRLSDVEPEKTEWLWPGRIPLGELTIFDGDPSCNKSSVTLDLAARVSTSREMPDGTLGVEGHVLLLLAEDSLEKTIIQRLSAAGANLDNISTFREDVMLPDHLGRIEAAIAQTRSRLVIIDPLMAFLSCDANGDQKVRRALGPLKRIADQANCAVIMVRHLTKRGGGNSLYRGSGSIGVVAATRSAFLIGKAPNDPDFRVLCHTKCNLAPLAPSLLFEPVTVDNSVVIEWRGECDVSAEDVLKPNTNDSRLCHAMSFLTELLADGPVEQKVIRQQSIHAGIALRTLERAKEVLGVESNRHGFGPGSTFFWSLPADNPPLSANDNDVADNEPAILHLPDFEHS